MAERDEINKLLGGNVQQRRAGTRKAAMRAMFGSSAVQKQEAREQQISEALSQANADAKAQGIVDPAQKQMLRLEAVRATVEESDPSLAVKLEDQIRQLRVQDLEAQKLRQEVKAGDYKVDQLSKRYILNPDTLESQEVDITTPEGLAAVEAARENGDAVSASEGALLNIFNAERARQFTDRQKKLDRLAKEAEDAKETGDVTLTTAHRTKLQGSLTANKQMMDQLKRASHILHDQEVLDMASRAGNWSSRVKDLLGMGYSRKQAEKYIRAQTALANIQGAANTLLKERSGAAVTESEWERAKVEIPHIGDGPDQIRAKMENLYLMLSRSNKRARNALQANDFNILDQSGDTWKGEDDYIWGKPLYQETPQQPAAPAADTGGFKVLGVE